MIALAGVCVLGLLLLVVTMYSLAVIAKQSDERMEREE